VLRLGVAIILSPLDRRRTKPIRDVDQIHPREVGANDLPISNHPCPELMDDQELLSGDLVLLHILLDQGLGLIHLMSGHRADL
jgi:hypothetical protein